MQRGFEDIFSLVNSGQFEQAELECRSFLENRPDNINVLGLLGAVLLKLGKGDEARPILEKTIDLEPRFAKPHEDLGMLCLHEGTPDIAVQHFEEAIRLDGNQAGAYAGLAEALRRLGEAEAARAARDQYVKLSPVAQALANVRNLIAAGHSEQAEEICDELSQRYPANIEILRVQAGIAASDGRDFIAEGLFKRIIQLSANDPRARNDLARFLGERNRFAEGVEVLKTAVALDPSAVFSRLLLGDFLSILGRSAEALETYDQALQKDPDNAPGLMGRGHILRTQGQLDEAIIAYESAITAQPDFSDAWWSLACLGSYRFSQGQLDTLRSLADNDDLSAKSQIGIRFALARACEDEGDFDTAWNHYVHGNSLKRSEVQYDPVRTELMHDELIQFLSGPEIFATTSGESVDGPVPIFIVGMPRSGSTLVEQILASHSQIDGAGELPYISMLGNTLGGPRASAAPYIEPLQEMTADRIVALGKTYLYHTRQNCPDNLPYFTDKMPANFSHVGFIKLILPNAKIIDVCRHPLDACVGNYRHLFAKGKNHSYELYECAEYYLEYERMMAHWDQVLPGNVLRVQYEDVVADLESQVRRMLEFCGLPWEDACLSFHESDRDIATASSEQVRAPIYTTAVGFWKNYEAHLDELKEILEPVLAD
jgi:Flp pilus assembly protein TadD